MASDHSPSRAPKQEEPSRADELRRVIRIDWVVYAVVIVVCVLALAALYPGATIDHALVGTLVTFATGVIGGLFAYLRYKARGNGKGGNDSG